MGRHEYIAIGAQKNPAGSFKALATSEGGINHLKAAVNLNRGTVWGLKTDVRT